uniref:Uncharacterized protein n=1 Tax=Anopheles merus TaxID=30066 RepID=A0A182VAF7_ANOME
MAPSEIDSFPRNMMSGTPSYCIRSSTMLSVIKTPVRPTPALQCTVIGPSWPNCSFVLCTWPMKSIKPSPDFGTPCSGQSMNWNWRTVRDEPSRASVTLNSLSLYCGMLYSAIGSTT